MNALPKIAQKLSHKGTPTFYKLKLVKDRMSRQLIGMTLLTGLVLPLAVHAAEVPSYS